MEKQQKSLFQLFVPLAFETLFFMLAGMVDTLMLSSLNDQAVGATGTVNACLGVFNMMLNIVSMGMMAVMTQYLGAGRKGVAYQARQVGVLLNFILGLLVSGVLFLGTDWLLMVLGVAPALMEYASIYMKLVGGFTFVNALIPVFSNYLRAFGHTKQPMAATIIANIVNVALNAVFLFVCKWGVFGVALATVISRFVNVVIVLVYSKVLINIRDNKDRTENSLIIKQILQIGTPAAFENVLYNVAVTLSVRFLNQMDVNGMNVTARAYAMQIANFSFCAGVALSNANAIMTGWRMGAKEYEACDKGTKKAALIGITIAVSLEAIFAIFAPWLVRLFTDDPEMISLVGTLLKIDIVLEAGRCSNLVFGQALKNSGDALFPTILAVCVMFSVMVGGTYLFGIRMGLCAAGAYIAMAMDECVRAIGMFLRWQSGKWKTKGLVKAG